ncbi:uncharacterized mitochondrial protein AtMg00820-like [Lathyrus oleraceus]|uniref:uncharacterized mitochondrial protein AtMg00820-like n=1 Tax=Pisum sativum TaxID=3888 RepID=UPI0021CE4BD1|nr:uncharacterized mitochondrial protein AtMg00820-like [Pisum sativum]
MIHPHWVKAMKNEIQALATNKTWTFIILPPSKKVIDYKWVYRTTLHADGTIERQKSMLVSKGFTEVEGSYFLDTFSPVAKLNTVILLLSLASSLNIYLHQFDVHNAFLHGDLNEEFYMSLPKSITHSYPNQVCKLLKYLYGLKQPSRQ